MPSFFRRAGAQIARVLASAAAPGGSLLGIINQYARTVDGSTQLFSQDSDGVEQQLTPPGIVIGNVISPASLSAGTTNNYAPTGLRNAAVIRQNVSGTNTITGIDAAAASAVAGRRITIFNIATSVATQLIIAHESGTSTAANRFVLPGSANWVIPVGGSLTFVYDATSTRWRLTSSATSALPDTQITPASLSSNQNNYNPTGLAGATIINQQISASIDLTGLVAQPANTYVTIRNIKTTGASEWIGIVHESGSSTAANRFNMPGKSGWWIPPGGWMTFFYDSTLSRWSMFSSSSNNFPANDPGGYPGMTVGNPVAHQGFYQVSTSQLAIQAGATGMMTFEPFASPLPTVTMPNDATFIVANQMRWSATVAIGPLTGTVNNQAITNVTGIARITTSGPTTLTGATGGAAGRLLTIVNPSANTITINSEDAGSTAANRFLLEAATKAIAPEASAIFWYDTTSARWRALS